MGMTGQVSRERRNWNLTLFSSVTTEFLLWLKAMYTQFNLKIKQWEPIMNCADEANRDGLHSVKM